MMATYDVERLTRINPDLPPYPALISEMDAGLMVNEDNRIWLIHDRPFPEYLHWIEYDFELGMLSLVYHEGRVQSYGRKIHPNMSDLLVRARQIFTMQIDQNNEIVDTYILPLIIRDMRRPSSATEKQKVRV